MFLVILQTQTNEITVKTLRKNVGICNYTKLKTGLHLQAGNFRVLCFYSIGSRRHEGREKIREEVLLQGTVG